jgi:dTDP-4-dehydrorhamnose 3,5-epimerase
MEKFKVIETPIKGLLIIETKIFKDERGFFIESYNLRDFENLGIDANFLQDNHSFSRKGVLRGLHFQFKHPQGKLVRVISGKVFDVTVDLRPNSSTFGKWYGVELSCDNGFQLFISPGFAHGFITLEDNTHFFYKCTDFYHPDDELGITWNDPDLNIQWPTHQVNEVIVSDKDRKLPSFNEMKELLIKEASWRKL